MCSPLSTTPLPSPLLRPYHPLAYSLTHKEMLNNPRSRKWFNLFQRNAFPEFLFGFGVWDFIGSWNLDVGIWTAPAPPCLQMFNLFLRGPLVPYLPQHVAQ